MSLLRDNISKDRLTIGFVSGLMGGIAMNIINYIEYYVLHSTDTRYLDYLAVLIWGKKPTTLWATIFAQGAQFLFAAFLGAVFIFFIKKVTSKNLIFKGWFYGAIAWFLIYAIGVTFKVPVLGVKPQITAASTFISCSIYGIVTAISVAWLNKLKPEQN